MLCRLQLCQDILLSLSRDVVDPHGSRTATIVAADEAGSMDGIVVVLQGQQVQWQRRVFERHGDAARWLRRDSNCSSSSIAIAIDALRP